MQDKNQYSQVGKRDKFDLAKIHIKGLLHILSKKGLTKNEEHLVNLANGFLKEHYNEVEVLR